MQFDKQYFSQLISAAANNIRLSPEKIESVGMLREMFLSAVPLDDRLKNMKKVTEFSKLAVRFSEIYAFLHKEKIDFSTLSEKFKEQSNNIGKEIGVLLDGVNISQLRIAMNKVETFILASTKEPPKLPDFDNEKPVRVQDERFGIMMEDVAADTSNEISFHQYESEVMRPIKNLDNFLRRMATEEIHHEEYSAFAKSLMRNAEVSDNFGTEIVANMHRIVAKTLLLIKNRELMPGKEVVDAIRACLIVIVALVKNKTVDISDYLNKAEDFGRRIKMMKVKE